MKSGGPQTGNNTTLLRSLAYDENIWKTAVECSGLGIWFWNLSNDELYFSDSYYRMLGYEPGEFDSRTEYWASITYPDDVKTVNSIIEHYFEKRDFEQVLMMEYRVRCKDGSYRWILEKGKVSEYDDEGYPVKMIGTMIEIDEMKEFGHILRESNEKFRTLVENTDDIIMQFDRELRFVYVNPGVVRLTSTRAGEFIGKSMEEMGLPEELIAELGTALVQVFETGERKRAQLRLPFGMWMEWNLAPLFDVDGNVESIIAASRDITLHKRIESELQTKKDNLEALFMNSTDAIVRCSAERKIDTINPKFAEIFGFMEEECEGQDVNELIVPDGRLDEAIMLDEASLAKETFVKETVRLRKDMTPIHVNIKAIPIIINEDTKGYYGIYTDITEKKKALDDLKESEELFRTLVENASDGIAIIQDGIIQYANKQVVDIIGYTAEEIIGTPLSRYIHADYIDELNDNYRKRISGQSAGNLFEAILLHKNGSNIEVEFNSNITMYKLRPADFVLIRNIQERKKVEERIKYLSFHDKLTGLYNRAFFEEELKRLDTERCLPLSLLMGDVNGLKVANDVFGHEEGDKLLQQIAQLFHEIFRKEDIIARVGGDEFAVILPNVDFHVLNEIVDRIKERCSSGQGEKIPLSISMGYATKTKPEQDISVVLNQAENSMYNNKLVESRSIRSSIIASLRQTLDERTHETEKHAQRLKDYSVKIGKKLGLDISWLNELELLAMLHDIGKIAIPDSILNKPGLLTEQEHAIMQKHSEIGYRIASTTPELVIIADGILSHHERWDGKGYPQGLAGEEIPLISRIVAVVDAFDAMVNDRIYRKAITREAAIEEIKKCSGAQFDPRIVGVFLGILETEDA